MTTETTRTAPFEDAKGKLGFGCMPALAACACPS